ncbi:MAG: hypothetical protein WB770_02105 [Acidimicrobiales bacterium]
MSWPAAEWVRCVPGAIAQSSPTVASYDGMTILAVGDESGMVHVLNARTGSELPGWPQAMAAPSGTTAAIEGSPAIAFLNGPNDPPSIVVGSASEWVPNSAREVEAFTFSGSVKWIFHVGAAPGTRVGVFSTPAIGSLSGGAQQDVVFGSWDHRIYALSPSGRLLPGFPINTADTVWSSPALYKVPGTAGGDSIFIGGDASGLDGCRGGWISDYHYGDKTPQLVWRHCEAQTIFSSPAIGVINSTGRAAVVVGTGFYEQPLPSATAKLFAYYASDGARVPGWPVTTPGPSVGSPAIGVINGSGRPAVVETSWSCGNSTLPSCWTSNVSEISAWSGSGHELWVTGLRGARDFSSPILFPLTSGGTWNDVLVGSRSGLYAIDGATGKYLFGTTATSQDSSINFSCPVFNSVAIADVVESAAASSWNVFEACGGPAELKRPGEIVSYKLELAAPTADPAWPMFREDSLHDGVAP